MEKIRKLWSVKELGQSGGLGENRTLDLRHVKATS